MKFDSIKENELLEKIQNAFGLEIFTPGLERTHELFLRFNTNFKKENVKIIIVAGTNGKGQTSHSINYYLNQNDVNNGLWTSPHILTIRERFVYNQTMISYECLEELIDLTLIEVLKLNYKISFYEFLFYTFLKWISDFKIDFLILEVGLGGRLDAVNHFDCDLAVITSISRDHQNILGNTYKLILNEKLGITRSGIPLISTFKLNYLTENAVSYCESRKIPYTNYAFNTNYFESNVSLAQKVLTYFNFGVINGDLPYFKGREEEIVWNKLKICFIGAHNPDGIRETLKRIKRIKRIQVSYDVSLISFSGRENGDLMMMANMLKSGMSEKTRLIFTYFSHPKSVKRQILEDVVKPLCNNKNIELISDWKSFLNGIKNQSKDNKILVVGSYYFIGEVQRFLLNSK